MRIRALGAADAEALRALLREARIHYGEAPMTPEVEARMLDLAAAGRHFSTLIALDGAGPLGFAVWTLLMPAGDGPALFMKELFVSPAARGRGVGRALMARLTEIAATEGCSRIDWTVDLDNPAAMRFYDAIGAGTAPKAFHRVEAPDFAGFRERLG